MISARPMPASDEAGAPGRSAVFAVDRILSIAKKLGGEWPPCRRTLNDLVSAFPAQCFTVMRLCRTQQRRTGPDHYQYQINESQLFPPELTGMKNCEKVSSRRKTRGPDWPLPRDLRHGWELTSRENSDPLTPLTPLTQT